MVNNDAVFSDDDERVFQIDRLGMVSKEFGQDLVDGWDESKTVRQIQMDNPNRRLRRGHEVIAVVLVECDDHSRLLASQPDHLVIG